MADQTKNTETKTENQTTRKSIPFSTVLKIYQSSIVPISAPTENAPGKYKFAEGITRKTLAEKMGYDPTSQAYATNLKKARDFFEYSTMKVEYNGEQMYGQQLAEKLGVDASQKKFLEFFEKELDSQNENPKFTKLIDGVSLPTFNGRTTGTPDILDMLGLIQEVQPESKESDEAEESAE